MGILTDNNINLSYHISPFFSTYFLYAKKTEKPVFFENVTTNNNILFGFVCFLSFENDLLAMYK